MGYHSQHSDWAVGWMIQGSNPGRAKRYFSICWVPGFFSGDRAAIV